MATNFTITMDACQADEFKFTTITVNAGAGSHDITTIWPVNTCGLCPYSKEELDKTCPNPEDRVKIYAYDGINQYEAENEEEKIAHQELIINSNGSYAWLFDCQKCILCDDLGSDSYFEANYCKCAEDNPSVKDISCPGAQIGPITLSSTPFNRDCLKFYDVYAKVNLTADNWGDVFGAGGDMINCPNEGTTQCYSKCINQQGDIKCIINNYNGYIDKYGDQVDNEPNRVRAQVFATATNSSNGGPYALDVKAQFYFKLKNT